MKQASQSCSWAPASHFAMKRDARGLRDLCDVAELRILHRVLLFSTAARNLSQAV